MRRPDPRRRSAPHRPPHRRFIELLGSAADDTPAVEASPSVDLATAMLAQYHLGVRHDRSASTPALIEPNSVRLTEAYRLAGVRYPVRELSWCFCGHCGPRDEEMVGRWDGVAAACSLTLSLSAARQHRRRYAAAWWAAWSLIAQADVAEALHRQLLVDLHALQRRGLT